MIARATATLAGLVFAFTISAQRPCATNASHHVTCGEHDRTPRSDHHGYHYPTPGNHARQPRPATTPDGTRAPDRSRAVREPRNEPQPFAAAEGRVFRAR